MLMYKHLTGAIPLTLKVYHLFQLLTWSISLNEGMYHFKLNI